MSAIADHPWVDEGAAMCIAMTVVYAGLSFQGINLVGKGLPLTAEQGLALGYRLVALPLIIRPHINALEKLVAFTLSSPATLLVLSSRAHELGSLGRGC